MQSIKYDRSGIGFGEEMPDAGVHGLGHAAFRGHACGADNFHIWVDGFECNNGGWAIHDRHHHVGDDRIDFLLPGRIKGSRLRAIRSEQDAITKAFQCFLRDIPNIFFVIHHQHQFIVAARQPGFLRVGVFLEPPAVIGGKIDFEAAAFARRAVAVDEPTVVFDNSHGPWTNPVPYPCRVPWS